MSAVAVKEQSSPVLPSPPPPPQQQRPHPRTLLPSELLPHLASLEAVESGLAQDLANALGDRSVLSSAHSRLAALIPRIDAVDIELSGSGSGGSRREGADGTEGDNVAGSSKRHHAEAGGLKGRIEVVNGIADRVGGKVRGLDLELKRVREANDRLSEVIELKSALETLRTSIEAQEWETAARSCARALAVPTDVLNGPFAARVVPSSDNPLPPGQALTELRQMLLETFNRQFHMAAVGRDEVATSRFFRLWPEIGAEKEGLQSYGDFVVGLVRSRNQSSGKTSSPMYFVAHLTSLFESIGLIVDQHQPVVEKYYGVGRMRAVVGRLQVEADRVVEGLVEGWEEERRARRVLNSLRVSSAAAATASKLAVDKGSLAGGLSSTHLSSLPNAASSLLQTYSRTTTRIVSSSMLTPTPTPPSGQQQQQHSEDDLGPDPREVDKLVGELTAMAGRWGLYRRFLWSRLREDDEPQEPADSRSSPLPPPLANKANSDGDAAVDSTNVLSIVESSRSLACFQSVLRDYYEPMETWFLRTSTDKALRLDTADTTSRPHLSSCPDDVFYLLKLVLYRLVHSGSLPTLERMVKKVEEIVEEGYLGGVKRKMDGVYAGVRSAGLADSKSSSSTGALTGGKGSDADRLEREMRGTFLIYANDLDVSAGHLERLIEELTESDVLGQAFLAEEVGPARLRIRSLGGLTDKFRSTLKSGVDQLFNQLVRPRLRLFIEDCYKGVSYALDEDGYAEAEFQDVVRKRFVRGWDVLLEGYRSAFTDDNYRAFFAMCVEVLVRPWEKLITGMKVTELGALRFDRDLRSISAFLSAQTSFGGGNAREKLIRLQQMATVLNLGVDEDPKDFFLQSGIPWRLSRQEYDATYAMRA